MVADAEKALRSAIEDQSKGQIKLAGFKKTDGRKLEAMGTQGYELLYEAELTFENDGTWITGATLSSGIGFNFDVLTGPRPKSISADLLKFAVSGKDVNRGDRAKISGTMTGQKYESGWKFTIGEGDVSLRAPPTVDVTRNGSTNEAQLALMKCRDNLSLIGLALRVWASDNDDKFPFNVPTERGGTMEARALGDDGFDKNAAIHFKALSNTLLDGDALDVQCLVCPSDSSRHAATNFQALQPINVSYQLKSNSGPERNYTQLQEVVAQCPFHGIYLRYDGSVSSRR